MAFLCEVFTSPHFCKAAERGVCHHVCHQVMEALKGPEAGMETSKSVLTERRQG